MKKKLLSLLLVLILVVSVTVISAMAEESTATPAGHTDHCVCGGRGDGRGDHVCADSGVITGWTAFTEELLVATDDTNRYTLAGGNYYLTADMTLTGKEIVILPDQEVTFCLNGFELTGTRRIFRVNGILNITDCQPTRDGKTQNGKITGNAGTGPVFYGYSGGHINLYRGILTAKTGVTRNWGGVGALGTEAGAAATKGSSSMTMYGGTIDASKLTITKSSSGGYGNGGAVVLFGTTADLDGDGTKETTYDCTFIQYGGTIKGAKSVEGYGSAIYGKSMDTIQILGNDAASGIVTGECAIAGGTGCNIVVGGGVQVSDLYMLAGQTFTTENLTGSIGLSTPIDNTAVLTTCTEAETACFTSKVTGRSVISTEVEGDYQITLGHADHCECGGNLTGAAAIAAHGECAVAENWIALTSDNIEEYLTTSTRESSTFKMFANSGHYYLAENIDLALPIEILKTQDISICLNGYELSHSAKKGSVFRVCGGTLNISDCTGEGTVKTIHTTTAPALYILNSYSDATEGVTVNLYGGTLKATDSNWGNKAGVVQVGNSGNNPCAFNVYGGTITGGKAWAGGNIFVERGTMNMYDGVVSGGSVRSNMTSENSQSVIKETANRGGNIYVNGGKFYMYGGSIEGGTTDTEYYYTGLAAEPNPAYGNDLYLHNGSLAAITLDCAVGDIDVAVEGTKKIALGDHFETNGTITCATVAGEGDIITGATPAMLDTFVAADETYQTVYYNSKIATRAAGARYACFCGGTYEGSNDIGHTCALAAWTAVDTEYLASSVTTTETVTTTDETTGETTTEEVTTVTGWGSPVTSTNATLGGSYYQIPSGYYYLTEDITLEHGLRVISGKDVHIDLNGHTITAPSDNARALFMQGSLRICDSSYDATKENKSEQFQGAIVATRAYNYSLAYVSSTGALRIYGGNYYSSADCSANTNAMIGVTGEVFIFDGYFEAADMNGTGALVNLQVSGSYKGSLAVRRATLVGAEAKNGGIIGSTAEGTIINIYSGNLIGSEVSGDGGAIYTTKGSVLIKNGTISGGEAGSEGGNIYAKTLTMYGGTVSGGTSNGYGGNICLVGGTCTIENGTIENGTNNNSNQSGGNICVSSGSLTVSGEDTLISGGKAQEGGNISVRSSGTLTLDGGTVTGGEAVKQGGNIAMYGTFVMNGGTVSNGIANLYGGNVSGYANQTDITINGGTITGGSLIGSETTKDPASLYGYNLCMDDNDSKDIALTINGGTITGAGESNISLTGVHILSGDAVATTTVSGAPVIDDLRLGTDRMLTVGELTEGANIGVSRFEIIGLFAPEASADYASYFHGTHEGISVSSDDTGLILVSENPYWAFTSNNKAIAPAATIAEAMQIEGIGFVKLIQDHASTEIVEGDVYLNLNGYDLSGLTVNGNLYVVDYATNDYEEGVAGSFSGTVTGAINDGKVVYNVADVEQFGSGTNYVKLANEDGSWSFHRVRVSITHVSLKAGDDALGFKATIEGDSLVQAAVTGIGFNMGAGDNNMVSFSKTGTPTDGVFTLRLKNIMANNGGELSIVGQPVIFFGEESVTGGNKTTSMKNTIEAVETALAENADAYTQTQIESVQALIAQYESKMEGWDIDTIKAWTAPSTEEETTAA